MLNLQYLVEFVECPVSRGEGGEDRASQLETASADAEGGLKHDNGCCVLAGS